MFCKKCGAECEDGTTTCPSCGAEVGNASAEAEKPGAEELEKLKGALKGKRKPLVIGGIAVLALVVVAIAFSLLGGKDPVSADQLKKDLSGFDSIKTGFVSQTYTKEAAYELTDVTIDETEQMKNAAGVVDYANVHFSGKISNGNFESSFTGYIGYYIGDKDAEPALLGEPTFDTVETKPLTGVSEFTFDDGSGVAKISDFEATFDEKDGVYTSVATQTATQSFWFADDVATGSQKFRFDPEAGWERDGDTEISKQETKWKLSGKTFSANLSDDNMAWDAPSGSMTGSIVLGELGDDGAVSAQYAISFVPEVIFDAHTYSNVDLSGTATGHVVHEFGADDFTIELNDPTGQVTLTCEDGEETSKAGVGDIPTMDVAINTVAVYETWRNGSTEEFVSSDLRYLLDTSASPASAGDQDESAKDQDESAKDQDAPAEDQDAPAEE